MMTAKRITEGLMLVLASVAFAGCQNLTTIKVQPATTTLVGVGQTVQLHADQLDADGKAMQKPATLTWDSDTPAIVTIAPDGTATTHKSGKATLSASLGSVKGSATVMVEVPAKLNGKDVTLDGAGKTALLPLQLMDDTGQGMALPPPGIAVASADTKVATVASQGGNWTVTAVAPGQTKLTATIGTVTTTLNVTVSSTDITDLKVTPASLVLKVGALQKLASSAMAGTTAAPASAISYVTSDGKIATVASDGTVKGIAKGKATITVKAGAKTTMAAVVVKK